jgi:hypothetical protein
MIKIKKGSITIPYYLGILFGFKKKEFEKNILIFKKENISYSYLERKISIKLPDYSEKDVICNWVNIILNNYKDSRKNIK